MAWIGPAISTGFGVAKMFGAGKAAKQAKADLEQQRNRAQDWANQSYTDLYRTLPQLESGYGSMVNDGGYSADEAANMYLTPDEQNRIRIGDTEAEGIRNLTMAPIAGAANRAQDSLGRRAAASGNYAPGANAAAERIQQEYGRQSAEAMLAANLGISSANRDADRYLGEHRTGTAGRVADVRLDQKNTGLTGLRDLAGLHNNRQQNFWSMRGDATNRLQGQPGYAGGMAGAFDPNDFTDLFGQIGQTIGKSNIAKPRVQDVFVPSDFGTPKRQTWNLKY